jgi:hypothetical protein
MIVENLFLRDIGRYARWFPMARRSDAIHPGSVPVVNTTYFLAGAGAGAAIGHSSVRKGEAGSPVALMRLQSGLSSHP